MSFKELTPRFIIALKGALLLMGYGIFITLFMWGGMYLVSFIPFVHTFAGAGPEVIFSLDKMVNFWMGIITGIMSLIVVAAIKGGTITINFQSSEETEKAEG